MKILSINNFTTKLLSKLLSDLYIGVHLKGTKKFGSKVINRQYFHRKTGFWSSKCKTPMMSGTICVNLFSNVMPCSKKWAHASCLSFFFSELDLKPTGHNSRRVRRLCAAAAQLVESLFEGSFLFSLRVTFIEIFILVFRDAGTDFWQAWPIINSWVL